MSIYWETMMKAMKLTKQAFTMIEVVVVTIVIGILAALVVPRFADAQSQTRAAATAEDLHVIARALTMYQGKYGQFPPNATRSQDAAILGAYFKGESPFEKTVPIGGVYDYEGTPTNNPVTIAILQDGSNQYTFEQAVELDAYMDNGDLSSGRLRESGGRLVYYFTNQH